MELVTWEGSGVDPLEATAERGPALSSGMFCSRAKSAIAAATIPATQLALSSGDGSCMRGNLSSWAADPQDRERLRERVRAFCRCIPDAHAVPVLTLTAHLEWWAGDGALSRTALDLARALDPDYRLAALLDRMLTEGIRVGEPLR